MLKIGFNDYIENNEYHADREYYSSSVLKCALRDVRTFYLKYIAKEIVEEKKGDSLTLGSYVHALILEPDKVDQQFADFSGIKRGKAWEEFSAKNGGKTVLGNLVKLQASEINKAIRSNKTAIELLTNGDPEVTAAANLQLPVKVRADYLKRNLGQIVDLKTTSGALTLESIQGTLVKWDYDIAAALYTDVFSQILDMDCTFYWVFATTRPPYDCAVYKASPSLLENGRRKYSKAIKIIQAGLETGYWYENGVTEIDMPYYGHYK